MKKAYSEFCSRHSKAVKLYKELFTRDKRFQQFIRVRSFFSPLPSSRLSKPPWINDLWGSKEQVWSLARVSRLVTEAGPQWRAWVLGGCRVVPKRWLKPCLGKPWDGKLIRRQLVLGPEPFVSLPPSPEADTVISVAPSWCAGVHPSGHPAHH